MPAENKTRENIDGSSVFVALKDQGNDVQGLLVKTPVGGSWYISHENGVATLSPDADKPLPEVTMTTANKLKQSNPELATMTRLDLRGGINADFARTETGFVAGNVTPQQGLPLAETEVQKILASPAAQLKTPNPS